ncbi:MAG: hypothetical protein ACYTFY_13790 [Planctomycetota bacterium]|jgi:hypothetical protein
MKTENNNQILWGSCSMTITPKEPQYLAGYFNKRLMDGILDDIEVRTVVLKQQDKLFVIMQFEVVTVSEQLANSIYEKIADIEGLSWQNMLITATHSHTAPEVREVKAGFKKEYLEFAAGQGVESLKEAMADLREGKLEFTLCEDTRFAFNRRYYMKNGEVVTNPGKLNSDIEKTEGEVDYDIPVLAVTEDSKIKVLLTNIVNHTDCIGGTKLSADWPGFTIKSIREKLGEEVMVMPLIGCAGNINHFDVSTDANQTSYNEAERVGAGYAETILQALPCLKPLEDNTLKTFAGVVTAASREIDQDELQEAEEILEKYKDEEDCASGDNLTSEDLAKKAPRILKYFAQQVIAAHENKKTNKIRVTGMLLGNVGFASLPCEPFVEIGLELKKEVFAGKNMFITSHSNGTGHDTTYGGYIPNNWNYGRGGYETAPRSNPFEKNTARLLIDGWKKIIEV